MPAPQTHVHSSSDTPVAFDRRHVYIIYSDHHQSPEKLSHLIQERKAFLGCEQICFSKGVLSFERTLLQTAPLGSILIFVSMLKEMTVYNHLTYLQTISSDD